jgi:hypothetical protein
VAWATGPLIFLRSLGDKGVQSINNKGEVIMKGIKECQIKFRLTAAMKEQIEAAAASKDVSASWIIREALKEYFQKESK